MTVCRYGEYRGIITKYNCLCIKNIFAYIKPV